MKVISLLENTTNRPDMEIEHGLSLYIEADGLRILFDMGQTDLFARNAEKLGVDLTKVDFAVLSHGHYDHGGGLEAFFKINHTAKVYVSKYVFEPHYNGTSKYIGLDENLYLSYSDRFIFTGDENFITDVLSLFNCNNNYYPYKKTPYGLKVGIEKPDEICKGNSNCIIYNGKHIELVPDDFRHEQYLYFQDQQSVLFSSCSHKGILNIMSWCNPDIFIGGFHLKPLSLEGPDADANKKELDEIARVLMSYKTQYYTCHCTGVPQYEYLKNIMGDQLEYFSTGMTLSIDC